MVETPPRQNDDNSPNQCVKISVVLPAKNESAAVGATVARIRALLPQAEILVVNDGSRDDTAAIAERAGARVLNHPYSQGNGAAIKTEPVQQKAMSSYSWMQMVNTSLPIFLACWKK